MNFLDVQKFFTARNIALVSIAFMAGGAIGAHVKANGHFPTEHKGLDVEQLAVVPEESMSKQLNLDGRILLARRITIMPGGQIARHSHETVPGIVFMESGSWTEGTDEGEVVHSAGEAFIEDVDTIHWFFNHGDVPASALVFDIKPAS
jgi:quercetin dioxygenase-like cupin family protein